MSTRPATRTIPLRHELTVAQQIAMKLFKKCGFTLSHMHLSNLMKEPLGNAFDEEDYGNRTFALIMCSDPDLELPMKQQCLNVAGWMRKLSVEIIMRTILDLIRVNPRFQALDPWRWIFLGCDFRDVEKMPRVDLLPGEEPEDAEFVDLWYDTINKLIRVNTAGGQQVYGAGFDNPTDYIGYGNRNVHEALRRARLLDLVLAV